METRVFRLTVRFLLSTVLAPRGVQKPTRSLRSKTLPPLSPFYSSCVMCNGVGCGCLSVQHPPPAPADVLAVPAGQERTPGGRTERCPFVVCTPTFIHGAQDTWPGEIKARICQPPRSRTGLWASVSSRGFAGTLFGEKRASRHSAWLCCIMTISSAAGNSLLPKSLQNNSGN